MSVSIWIAIGIIFVLVWGMIIWEMFNAPIYPDDYPNSINSYRDVKGEFKKTSKTGFYNGDTDVWINDNKRNKS
jgi:hypothetical protein